jgi:hypothetical protein
MPAGLAWSASVVIPYNTAPFHHTPPQPNKKRLLDKKNKKKKISDSTFKKKKETWVCVGGASSYTTPFLSCFSFGAGRGFFFSKKRENFFYQAPATHSHAGF